MRIVLPDRKMKTEASPAKQRVCPIVKTEARGGSL